MASTIKKLSALGIRSLCKPGYYGDGGGLWLQVSRTGSKSWIFRYDLAGTRREMGLGSINFVDLPSARAKAQSCRQMLHDGIDPLENRRVEKALLLAEKAKLVTFDQCAKAYIAAHRTGWRNPKHAQQWENTLAGLCPQAWCTRCDSRGAGSPIS